MPAIDLRSVLLVGVFIVFICTLLMVVLWRQNRRRFDGLALLAGDFVLRTLGMVLIMLRGIIPDWLSIVVSGSALVGGALLGWEGMERLVNKRSRYWPKWALMTAFFLIQVYFTYVHHHMQTRSLNIAVALMLISLGCAWLLLVRVEAELRPASWMMALVYLFFALTFLSRIVFLFIRPVITNDYLRTGPIEAGFNITWQIQFILMTYAIALMVNRRLVMAVESQEEKFSKAFHSSPNAITITRLIDGEILEVNNGFIRMTGLFSADKVVIGGEVCILSSISDITDRKRSEEERARLLAEKEKALSEIKILSGLLPICAWCKKIRDDKGYWNQIESYINTHSEAAFSHSICPDCMSKFYKKSNTGEEDPPV